MIEKPRQKRITPIIVIIGVIIVPLLYSYFYLGAFWDPYSRLDTVPVALVNEDKGATINGTERNVGQEVCDELKNDGSLKFIITDTETAKKGMEGKKYYATITIPSDFSQNISSVSSTDKKLSQINFTANQKRNYLAAQILTTAVGRIEKSVRSSINKEIVSGLSDKLKSSPEKLTTLTDGLGKLYDGSSDLSDGTTNLLQGANDLNDGALTLADGTSTLANGSNDLQNGISSLSQGVHKLFSGSNDLLAGAKTFAAKMNEYKAGVQKASSGSKTISDNMSSLDKGIGTLLSGATTLENATKNLGDLKTGANSLATGAAQLNNGIIAYTTGVDTLITNVGETTKVLSAYAAKTGDKTISAVVASLTSKENQESLQLLAAASTNLKTASSQISAGATLLSKGTSNITDLKSGIHQIKEGLETAKSGSSALSTGSKTLSDSMVTISSATNKLSTGATSLKDGASKLNSGLNTLQDGTNQLSTGATALNNGATKLDAGADKLQDGTNKLVEGATALNDGSGQLKDGIKTAKDEVSNSISDANEQLKSLDGLDTYAKDPVEFTTSSYAEVPNYGTAFAPYFMSLSLWVGGLMIFFGIYLDADEKFKLLSRNSDNKILRTFTYLLIGFVQAIILAFVLLIGLGLKVNHLLLFFGSCILVSLTFISIIQFFLIFFKDVGKFLSLLMLILQLTPCGGTFPMETVPNLFNVLYPFMPMTYSVNLFKEAISGVGNHSLAVQNTIVLILIFLVFITATLLFTKGKKVTEDNLVKA